MSIAALFGQAAAHLSGRSCLVRLQPPIWSFAGGAAYRTKDNQAIIDVDPGSTDILFTFCHEVSHVLADWSKMAPADVWRAQPGSLSLPDATRATMRARPMEDLADKQARAWLEHARGETWRFPGDNRLERELRALIAMPVAGEDGKQR